jgi:RNA polymerase sigma factor (sigma-70 family)
MVHSGEVLVERQVRPAGEDEDEPLWRAAAAGDHAAFEALIERHAGRVTSMAVRFLPNPSDVEDVVQETFLRAFENLRRFRGGSSLRVWLLQIAINLCKNRRRGFWWRRVRLTDEDALLASQASDPRDLAEKALARGELDRAIRQLPEHLQLPFVLRHLEELSGAEIAAVLGWNESTVWTRIYAAQRELRKKLEG